MSTDHIPMRMSSHSELTSQARTSLTNKWGVAVLTTFVFYLISMGAAIIPLGGMIVGGPLTLGLAAFALNIAKGEHAEVGHLFTSSDRWLFALATYLLYMLAIIVGFILLIIPGIIAAIGLSQSFYILAENKEMDPVKALQESWKLMDGHKWDYFVFGLRFIPWALLCLLTLGIGILWLVPYMQVSFAKYYMELRGGEDEDEFDPLDHLIEY